ncbi:uncharacterized protein LOC126821612 [Patella vulgata]|uniref:uncharacterized protein LOC126821612 n=1 Tax=Patella vulgata TaxID=6465 RepID=UPI0024A7FFA5|nr:uncharacterized protein LOC126821612 [Patella vulgata]
MGVIFYVLVIAGYLITFSSGQSCFGNFVALPCSGQSNPSRQFFIPVNSTLINDVNCQCEVRLIKTPTDSNKTSLFPVTFRIIDDVNCGYDVNVVYGTSSSSVVCKEAPTFTRQIVRDDSLLFAFFKRAASSLTSSGFCLQVIADLRDTFITINCDNNVSNSSLPDTSTSTTSTTEIVPTSSQSILQTASASSSWLSPSFQQTSTSQFSSSSSSSSSSSPSPSSSSQSTAYHSPSSGETTFTSASSITLLSPSLTPASSTPPSSSSSSSSSHSPSSGKILFTTASSVTVLNPSQTPLPSSTPPSSPPAASATIQLNTIRETDNTTTITSETTNSELIPVIAAGLLF